MSAPTRWRRVTLGASLGCVFLVAWTQRRRPLAPATAGDRRGAVDLAAAGGRLRAVDGDVETVVGDVETVGAYSTDWIVSALLEAGDRSVKCYNASFAYCAKEECVPNSDNLTANCGCTKLFAGARGGASAAKVNFGSALAVLGESQAYLEALSLLLENTRSESVVPRVTELVCRAVAGAGFWRELGADLTSLPLHPDTAYTSVACGGVERYTNCAGAPCYDGLAWGEGRNVTCTCPMVTYRPGDGDAAGPVSPLLGDCPGGAMRGGCAYNMPPGDDWQRYALGRGWAGLKQVIDAVRAARPKDRAYPYDPSSTCPDPRADFTHVAA